jgi:hypothetical protein
LVSKKSKKVVIEKGDFGELDKSNPYKFGKIGYVGIFLGAGTAAHTQSGSTSKKLGGSTFGMTLKGEMWATRKWWAGLDIGKKFGSLKKEEGTFSKESFDIDSSLMKFKVGYKYLPMGFFYGPQIDGYLGYASYTYGLDTSTPDNITEISFKGPLFGVKGSMPLMKGLRGFLLLDFILSPSYEESTTINSDEDSASSFNIEIGAVYAYSPSINIEGGVLFNNSKAKFTDESEVKVKDTSLQLGVTFTY